MNPERWQCVKQLLVEVLTVESRERSSFLDRACDGDSELRHELDSLLASHERAGTGFLKAPAADLTAIESKLPRQGHRIGVYQIIEQIGHGGMAEVYRAVRADGQYTKDVAVKLVRGGYDTDSMLERFRNERQILASLDHPNIARLLDGGTTDDGIPYLVMELVEGTRIDLFCDEHKLTITERLQLFRQVCSAVQYAHQHLVIHRDIKPSNILVTNEGGPKLLDFGIAKILDPAHAAETTLVRPMTPEYASPEQIRGEPITTASDVYSLGVVLYQLLTGRSPYSGETRSSHELARAVCETDPGRPSVAFLKPQPAHSGEQAEPLTPEQISLTREGSPAKLHRRLTGDVDSIVLMALRKEPQRRYASVEQFAEDLRRHLEGLPVTASKSSWNYRAGKFARRHRVGMAAAALVFLTLLAGVAATLREARIATANERRAEQRFNDVRQLADTLLFEVHDSIQDLPGSTAARRLIVQRSLEYLNRLAKDSGGDVSLQRELASAYERIGRVQGNPEGSNLGDTTGALDSFGKALSIREKIANSSSHNRGDLIALAASDREMCGMNARYVGNIGTALDYCKKALSIAENLSQADSTSSDLKTELAKAYEATGRVYGEDSTIGNAGDSHAALNNHRKALDLVEELAKASPGDPALRSWTGRLSILTGDDLFLVGKASQALPLYQQATRTFEDLSSQNANPSYARSLTVSYQRLGDMMLSDGHYAQSLVYYRKQLEGAERLAASDQKNMVSRIDLAAAHATYGHALWRAGRVPEALSSLRQGLAEIGDTGQKNSRAKGLETLLILWKAGALEKGGSIGDALHDYLLTRAAYSSVCESDPKDVEDCLMIAGVQDRIAGIYVQEGKLDEAVAEYEKALALSEPLSIGGQPNLAALYTVVNIYYGMGEDRIALTHKSGTPGRRLQSWKEARVWYEKSHAAWLRIPEWRPITPNEFESRSLKQIEARLSLCQTALGRVADPKQNAGASLRH
jgi:eukaryotic-like serine/threonine-protein kinase